MYGEKLDVWHSECMELRTQYTEQRGVNYEALHGVPFIDTEAYIVITSSEITATPRRNLVATGSVSDAVFCEQCRCRTSRYVSFGS